MARNLMRRWQAFKSIVGVLFVLISWQAEVEMVGALGVNWGTISSDPLSNSIVVGLLKDNSLTKVKLFDADSGVISSMSGTNFEVMVGIANDMLATLAGSTDAATSWVKQNVTTYLGSGGVNIKYVAVGNEPFLNGYDGKYQPYALPALQNIQSALAAAGHADVLAVVPCNADVLSSASKPSQQTFRSDLASLMLQIVAALHTTNSPFVINLYPFLSLVLTANFPIEYAFFDSTSDEIVDGTHVYTNVFDASYDGLVSALTSAGYSNMSIIVGEIGWPTDGAPYANTTLAQKFNQELVNHLESGNGTPLRPGKLEAYLFSLLDENAKSTLPGNFERHWGIFAFDGSVKYPLDLTGGSNGAQTKLVAAQNVPYYPDQWCVLNTAKDQSTLGTNIDYACSHADCTPLYWGGSCSGLTLQQNASYAFNTYYQFNNQLAAACDFEGLAQVTTTDPSVGTCKFLIGVKPSTTSSSSTPATSTSSGASSHAVLRILLVSNSAILISLFFLL